ncbi:MAG: hypothetical protein JOZ20_01135 [Sphingomonas sp.]|nr:hypothetical protein [Sphingomonas sp.]MBW0007004.1 hypothetical protein [Sphingomonas sp.]
MTARAVFGVVLALLLAVRLLSPAGFMPAFDHGSVSIVACPDYDPPPAPMAHHGQHGGKHQHQPCPYAAGGVAGTATDLFLLAVALFFAAVPMLGRSFDLFELRRSHERPPLRGPPATA